MILPIEREGLCIQTATAFGGAAGHVAMRVIASSIVGTRLAGTGGTHRSYHSQRVRVITIAGEILLHGAGPVVRAGRDLPQVVVAIDGMIACAEKRIAGRAVAAARRGLRGGVASPGQPVLFVITEDLRLAASRIRDVRNSCLRRREIDQVAGSIVVQPLAEEGCRGTVWRCRTGRLPA